MDKSDIDELFLQRGPSPPADHTRRELYTMPKDGKECENCANFGKRHCWARKSDGSGSWDESYCCTPSDSKCRSLEYCSDEVKNPGLKVFTCPVDKNKCEMGSKAEIRTRTWDVPVTKTKKFPAYSIRDTTYCKYSIKNYAAITTDRFKHNNMNVFINWENLTAVYMIWIPRGTPWGDKIRIKKLR